MSSDLESFGILFELQWKKKPGGNNREDVASLGIWDTPDSSLDWLTFKSYVCQNLGTLEDIYVTYVDSDGDELPIESECEFQEALKFARQRASKGREVVLKVDKRGGPQSASQCTESAQKEFTACNLITDSERYLKKKHSKASGKSKAKSEDKIQSGMAQSSDTLSSSTEERKSKADDHSISNGIGKKLACVMKLETDKMKRAKAEKDDSPPLWFKKYMQKFKSEIVAEVTANVMCNTRQVIESAKVNCHPPCHCGGRNGGSVTTTKTKKKTSDEDSSDGALGSDQRHHKLLKKIEKLQKQERKLEKKLDSKLEKLENKTKRRMEKKFQSKPCSDQTFEKKACSGTRKRMSDGPVCTYLMDAVPLSDGPKPAETHIRLGERFTKVWEIMNSGTLPWTDKTELRLAWGTSGLEPTATVLKCPVLMPGEKGIVAVTFQAPEFTGTFESYWHFYHMGVRFGHWLGCAVVVDSKEPEKQEVSNMVPISSSIPVGWRESNCDNENNKDKEMSKAKVDQPVDLRKKYEPDQMASSSVVKCVVRLDDTYDKINEDKTASTESGKVEARQRNAEYESDSDDENLSSVISVTFSITSESEEDENFVVVPMPPCFMCDVPLDKSNAVPLLVKDQVEKSQNDTHDVQIESETNLLDTVPSSMPDAPCTVNTDFGTANNGQNSNCEVEDSPVPEMSIETSSHDDPSSHGGSEYVMPSRNEVYAVDMAGHCMPVDFVWTSHSSNHYNNTFVDNSDMNAHSSKSSSMTDLEPPQNQGKRGETKHDQTNGRKPSLHSTAGSPTIAGPIDRSCSTAQPGRNGQTPGSSFNNTATSPTHSAQNGFEQHENRTPSLNTAEASSPNQPQEGIAAAVHILPETLVNGAINVASQAYTTARAVFSNLRSRPGDFAEWHWNDRGANLSSQSDMSTTNNLKILLEMGFTNKNLNVLLLQRYDNDMEQVVAELLSNKSHFADDNQMH